MIGSPLARAALVLALVGTSLVPPGASAQEEGPFRNRTVYQDLQLFSQVLNQIRVNHPDSVDTHELFMAAVEAMVRAADPHSYVLPATRLAPDREQALRDGELVPVPVEFRFVGGAAVVASVSPGSRAARLDILPGDELVAADSAAVEARSAPELQVTLAGPEGSTVDLLLERRRVDGSLVRLERTVERERVEERASAVPASFMLDDVTGYVRVTTFASEDAADDLHRALEDLEVRGMERLLLDLRDNGGGLLDEAARVAGEFLPEDEVVYTTGGSKAEVADTGRVERSFWRSERRYPIVVLVNEGTASAAELVAGALQDHDRALIVGRTTFGKALLMQGFPLTDGSLMMLVVGQVRTPCGRSIQREYRTITRREYYRSTVEERKRAGRPTCETAGGRTVYGGGGVHPDVRLEASPDPVWLARIHEQDLPQRWLGGYLDARADRVPDLHGLAADPTLPDGAVERFRAFVVEQGLELPEGEEADARLERALLPRIAAALWGTTGYYRIAALLDPEVRAAAVRFGEAGRLPRSGS